MSSDDIDLTTLQNDAMEQARELVERFHSDLLAPCVRRQRDGAYEQKVQEYYRKCYVERIVALGKRRKKDSVVRELYHRALGSLSFRDQATVKQSVKRKK